MVRFSDMDMGYGHGLGPGSKVISTFVFRNEILVALPSNVGHMKAFNENKAMQCE